MADVFISYAREDQSFVHLLAHALQSEGLSVSWDHAARPGQSSVEGAARSQREASDAAAVIVVWSRASAQSEPVKEEAAAALRARKLMPVRIDDAEPPFGFTRMHAAHLGHWRGDGADPQWAGLLHEVRAAAHAARGPGAPPLQAYAAPPAPAARPWSALWAIGLVIVVALAASALFVIIVRPGASTVVATAAPATAAAPVMVATAAPDTAPRAAPAPLVDESELQALREEHDAAIARQHEAEAALERERNTARYADSATIARDAAVDDSATSSDVSAVLGEWASVDDANHRYRFVRSGSDVIWYMDSGEGYREYHRGRLVLKPSGYFGWSPVEGNAFEVRGSTLYLHYDSGEVSERQVTFRRGR